MAVKPKSSIKTKASVKSKTASKNKEAVKPNKKIISGQNDFTRVSEDITSNVEVGIHKEWNVAQSEDRYRTILEEMEDAYFEVDLAGNYTFINDAICRHLKYSREELIGRSFRDQLDKEDAKKLYNSFSKIYATGISERGIVYKIFCKDGTFIL